MHPANLRGSRFKGPRTLGSASGAALLSLLFIGPTPMDVAQAAGDPPPTAEAVDAPRELADLSLEELLQVPVIVTASRHEEGLDEVAYAVSVITAEDIRRAGAHTVPEALRLVPGVDVADLSAAQSAVSPRGFHGFLANHVLVMVDGRQVYDSVFGGTVWGCWPFMVEDIERIEVIRGPGGVTWGPNAVNGVINIITKDPADQQGLTLSLRGGSRGAHSAYTGYGTTDQDLRLRISGEYDAHDGFIRGGSFLHGLDDDVRAGRLSLHAIHEADDEGRVTISAGSAVLDGGFPATPLAGIGVDDNPHSEASYILGRWERDVDANSAVSLTGFVNDFHVTPGVTAIDYRYQQLGLQFSHEIRPSDERTLRWGVDTRVDLLDAGNSSPRLLSRDFVSTAITGVYLNHDWRFAPKWTFSLGGRVDYENYAGFLPSARASLAFDVHEGGMLYAAVSHAAQVPTAAGRFLQLPLVNGLVVATVDRAVDPTTAMVYELGYRGRFGKAVETSLTLFWHQYDELTTFSPELGPPGLIDYRLDNRSGAASLYGVEWEGIWRPAPKLSLRGNYTYQQMNWDPHDSMTARDYMTPPKHKFMISAAYDLTERSSVAGHVYYVDAVWSPNPDNPLTATRIDPYVRLDLQLEHVLAPDRASLTVGVKNLLDSGHPEGGTLFLSSAETPRMVFAEVRIRIPR